MLSNTHTHTHKEKVSEFAWCRHGNNLAADLALTRSHSCLGQWRQAKPEVSDWGEQQDELWRMNELANQSILDVKRMPWLIESGLPEQSDSVVQRTHKEIWILVSIHIMSSRQRVAKGCEAMRDGAAPDHLERPEVCGHRCSSPVLYLLASNTSLTHSHTWLGSLETPSLLLVQIITIPVSWNGAPTAKSETFLQKQWNYWMWNNKS